MRVSEVRIPGKFKRFGSLEIQALGIDVELVVMLGPNGTGKSSVFDAFLEWARARVGQQFGGLREAFVIRELVRRPILSHCVLSCSSNSGTCRKEKSLWFAWSKNNVERKLRLYMSVYSATTSYPYDWPGKGRLSSAERHSQRPSSPAARTSMRFLVLPAPSPSPSGSLYFSQTSRFNAGPLPIFL